MNISMSTLSSQSMKEKIYNMENLLNSTIGASYYKRYIGAVFWNNISTPINLAITLMSAVNTGQATTGNLISSDTFFKLSIATLILTSINTFFRPNDQMNINNEYSRKWIDFGTKFEEIFLSNKTTDDKYKEYYKLNQDIHSFENTQTTNQNCFIDIIYKIVSITCLNGKQTWFKVSNGDYENFITQPHSNKEDIENAECIDCCLGGNKKKIEYDMDGNREHVPHPLHSFIHPEREIPSCMPPPPDHIPSPPPPPPLLQPSTPRISTKKVEWREKLNDNITRIIGERNIIVSEAMPKENKEELENVVKNTKTANPANPAKNAKKDIESGSISDMSFM